MKKKEIRKKFRDDVFLRDKLTCQICKTKSDEDELDAHHITDRKEMPNGGYVLENGITVCKGFCHYQVECFHISGGETWKEGLHPDNLYTMIGSSKELAVEKSKL